MARIKYETDASQSVRAQKALTDAQEKYNKTIGETPQKLSKAEKAARRLAEQADPQEKYNRKMLKLAEAVQKGGLEQEKALALTRKYQQALDRTGDSGRRAFGSETIRNIGAMVTGYFSIGAAIGKVSQALQQVEQDNQRVADSFFNGLGAIGELQQVSATPEEFRANLGFARSLIRRGIVSDPNTAADISFTTAASGFTAAEREFLATVAEKKQVAPEKLLPFAENIGTVGSLYDGATLQDAADKLTLGAKGIKKGGFAETAQQIAKFASTTKTLGFSGDESIAALVLAENAGVPLDTAGTQVAQLLSAIDAKRLNQGSLRASVQGIQERINAGETANEVLGNVRAIAAFRQVQGNLGRFDSLVAELANSEGALAGRDFINDDPITRALSLKEKYTGRRTAGLEERTSEKEALLDALLLDIIENKGGGGFIASAERARFGVADITGGENNLFRTVLRENAAAGGTQISNDLRLALIEYLRRIADNTANANAGGGTKQEN